MSASIAPPAFNLPVGADREDHLRQVSEYHTSADNKDFVRLERFTQTVDQLEDILRQHESWQPLRRTQPYCRVPVGQEGLVSQMSIRLLTWGRSSDSLLDSREQLRAINYILSYADGEHDLNDVAGMTGIELSYLSGIADKLLEFGLLK